MKILAWGAAVGAMAALVACGGSGGNTGGAGGGTGGSTPSSSSSSTSVSSSSSTGSSSSGTGGGNAAACGIYWEDPADTARAGCETCMEDNCCSELQGCAAGSDCDALLTCANACPNPDTNGCVDGCINSHSQGLTDYQTLQSCYSDNCQTIQECEYPICDSMLLYPDQKCAECLGGDTTCCGALTACANDQTCAACASAPTTAGCDTNTLYQPVDTCFGTTCGPVCTSRICGSTLGYTNFASCNYCLSQNCCTQFDACIADMNSTCYKCLTSSSATGCDTDATFQAFKMCRDVTSCKDDC